MAPVHSFPTAHKAWRTSPAQKEFIEGRLATLPTHKPWRGDGLDTSACGSNWRKNWRTPWAAPEEPALKDAPATEDFYVRPTYFCAPLVTHARFFAHGLACPQCEDGGEVMTGCGWNPAGPRKVRFTFAPCQTTARAPVLPHSSTDVGPPAAAAAGPPTGRELLLAARHPAQVQVRPQL